MTFDYLFVFSSAPVPRLTEKVRMAVEAGRRVAVVYLRRGVDSVVIEDVPGCTFFPYALSHRGVDLRRALALPKLALWLRREVLSQCEKDAIVYADSLDLLGALRLTGRTGAMTVHYEVRDLARLQLDPGWKGRVIRLADRTLMRGVSMLALTSEYYHRVYYSKFYRNDWVLIENWPDPGIWQSFTPKPAGEGPFVIAFVGAIRYVDCLRALIEGARKARALGHDVRVRIAGATVEGSLETDPEETWIERSGPFNYQRDITRLYADVDVVWSVYDTRIENVRYAISNKYYESILGGIPVAVAAETYIGELVEEAGIGIALADRDPDAVVAMVEDAMREGGWWHTARARLDTVRGEADTLMAEHEEALRVAVFGRGGGAGRRP